MTAIRPRSTLRELRSRAEAQIIAANEGNVPDAAELADIRSGLGRRRSGARGCDVTRLSPATLRRTYHARTPQLALDRLERLQFHHRAARVQQDSLRQELDHWQLQLQKVQLVLEQVARPMAGCGATPMATRP